MCENNKEPILICPHCNEYIIIEKINCGIFRHGIFKNNGNQIDPHSCKADCDKYVKNDLIYGCGKPFRVIINEDGNFIIEICEYI